MDTALPPGPALPALAQTALSATIPNRILRRWRLRYGPTFTCRVMGFGTVVYLSDPADIKAVFRGERTIFHAGEANAFLAPILGDDSVLVTDDEQHRRTRALMMPAFHGDSVRHQIEQMIDITAAEVATWPLREAIPLHPRMKAIALEVILRTVIGVDDDARLTALRRLLPELVNVGNIFTLRPPHPALRNLGPWGRRARVHAAADTQLYDEIARRRADPRLAERTDVLSMLVRSTDDAGGLLSDRELRDQLVTLLLAGHETTATALSWTVERLVRNPEVLARATRAAEGETAEDDAYLDAVAKESLRARPVIFEVGRVLTEPTEVAGYRLPAGVLVAPSITMVQWNPQHYPEPEEFRPERFLETRADSSTYFPFGGGVRRCLGASFATVELRVVLREILRRIELGTTSAPAERIKVRHVTLIPADGARVRIRSRRSAVSRAG